MFQRSAVYTYGLTFILGLMLPFMKNVRVRDLMQTW